MSVIVRPLRKSETKEVSLLFREAIGSVTDYTPRMRTLFQRKFRPSQIADRVFKGNVLCLVAVQDKRLVGFVYGAPAKQSRDGVFWMNWAGVTKEARRAGVARKLMKALETYLKRNGFHKIWFNTDKKNTQAAKVWKRLGYRYVTTIKNHWYGMDALIWDKEL